MTQKELNDLTNKIVAMVVEEVKHRGLDQEKEFGDVGEAMLVAMQMLLGIHETANIVARSAPKPAPGY